MIVNASPTMNPFRTGSEMKLARNPSRSRPAISGRQTGADRQRRGHRHELHCCRRWRSSDTVAADSAAVADIGPMIECRELPNAAYKNSAPGAA